MLPKVEINYCKMGKLLIEPCVFLNYKHRPKKETLMKEFVVEIRGFSFWRLVLGVYYLTLVVVFLKKCPYKKVHVWCMSQNWWLQISRNFVLKKIFRLHLFCGRKLIKSSRVFNIFLSFKRRPSSQSEMSLKVWFLVALAIVQPPSPTNFSKLK